VTNPCKLCSVCHGKVNVFAKIKGFLVIWDCFVEFLTINNGCQLSQFSIIWGNKFTVQNFLSYYFLSLNKHCCLYYAGWFQITGNLKYNLLTCFVKDSQIFKLKNNFLSLYDKNCCSRSMNSLAGLEDYLIEHTLISVLFWCVGMQKFLANFVASTFHALILTPKCVPRHGILGRYLKTCLRRLFVTN